MLYWRLRSPTCNSSNRSQTKADCSVNAEFFKPPDNHGISRVEQTDLPGLHATDSVFKNVLTTGLVQCIMLQIEVVIVSGSPRVCNMHGQHSSKSPDLSIEGK